MKRDAQASRDAIFLAAADLFSRRGFDSVTVDDIAKAAGVNRAMLYYHFTDKLTLYRDIVSRLLDEAAARVSTVVESQLSPAEKLEGFINSFVELAATHPYLPPLMLREISEGALHFDAEILNRMRAVFQAFMRVLSEGQESGEFRAVNPVLAYLTVIGPVLLNTARERAAAQHGREQMPIFQQITHDDLARHVTDVARRMLTKDNS
jgi:AcrR family transcriptional regulator